MNSFERFLLKNRPYCELCTGPYPSRHIIELNRRKTCVCDAHYRAHTPLESGFRLRAEIEQLKGIKHEHQRCVSK